MHIVTTKVDHKRGLNYSLEESLPGRSTACEHINITDDVTVSLYHSASHSAAGATRRDAAAQDTFLRDLGKSVRHVVDRLKNRKYSFLCFAFIFEVFD